MEESKSGLTSEELEVMDLLGKAWNKFCKLKKYHPSHLTEFNHHIHELQRLIAIRVLKRLYPDYWKSYPDIINETNLTD